MRCPKNKHKSEIHTETQRRQYQNAPRHHARRRQKHTNHGAKNDKRIDPWLGQLQILMQSIGRALKCERNSFQTREIPVSCSEGFAQSEQG